MTGRSVDEWRGATPDSAIPARVKLRVWERCGGRCALTGRKLMPGDAYDFDHIVALVNGGAHAEANLQIVCRTAHKAKTVLDVGLKAKADRIRAKHLGIIRPKGRIQSRGFEGSQSRRPVSGKSATDAKRPADDRTKGHST